MLTTLLLLSTLAGAAQRPAYSPRRLALPRQLLDVEAAPDGKTAFFVTDVTGALELWSAPARGGWPAQLTDLGEWVSEPAVSPDGTTIAFAADHGGDERHDLYLVPAAGGETAQLTTSTRAETSPAWSPDGAKLAFLADPKRGFLFQLFVMDVASRTERQLTDEPEKLWAPVWSPDGRWLAAARSGDDRSGPLILAAADGSSVRRLPAPTTGGILIPEEWSPDGESLLCVAQDADGFRRLYLLDPSSGTGRFIGPSGWDVERALWRRESGVVFTRNEGGASAVYRLKTPDAALERLAPAKGRVERLSADAGGRTVFLVWSDSAHAPDVWSIEFPAGKRTQLTRSMLGGIEPKDLARGEIVSYPSFDGLKIHALYLKPPVARLGTPPPLVVVIHGGPDLQTSDAFDPLNQALAEAGFAVLAPNYRGSLGFGRRFLDANRKDWGGKDRLDMIEGVKFLAGRGEIDPKRVGITGGSYGGYSTLYALARSSGEWAAGVAAYGMVDLVQDYELSKDRFLEWYETQMGNPKDDAALFKDRSALTYIENLKAPLLVFQGANDTNVPEAEARLVRDKLQALGRDVELVVYPDEGHGFTRRKNLADYYERTVAFFRAKLARTTP